jgi:hypothetical protein
MSFFKNDDELLKYYKNAHKLNPISNEPKKRNIYIVIDNLTVALPTVSSTGGFMKSFSASEPEYTKLIIDFPIDFVQTSNPRFVHVKNAKYCSYPTPPVPPDPPAKTEFPQQISIYSDIIQDEKYSNTFLCFCNESFQQYKSLQIYDARTSFSLWLRNEKGEIMDILPSAGRVVLELLLEF